MFHFSQEPGHSTRDPGKIVCIPAFGPEGMVACRSRASGSVHPGSGAMPLLWNLTWKST